MKSCGLLPHIFTITIWLGSGTEALRPTKWLLFSVALSVSVNGTRLFTGELPYAVQTFLTLFRER